MFRIIINEIVCPQDEFTVDMFVFGINLHYSHVFPKKQEAAMKSQVSKDLLFWKKVGASSLIFYHYKFSSRQLFSKVCIKIER